jgi:internalin A
MCLHFATFVVLSIAISLASDDGQMKARVIGQIDKLGGTVTRNEAGEGDSVILASRLAFSLGFPTDSQLEEIDLRQLNIYYITIISMSATDRALNHVAALPPLKGATVSFAPITDDGLASFLKKQKSLTALSLTRTKITDKSLLAIARLGHLRYLSLASNSITDKGVERISGLLELRDLCLRHTRVTDRGLGYVKKLTKLRGLDLHGTDVTDAGILQLREMKTLRTLSLASTKVTTQGAESLRQSLPLVQIRMEKRKR